MSNPKQREKEREEEEEAIEEKNVEGEDNSIFCILKY